MKPVRLPPIQEPVDLITAKAHAWFNGFFLQVPNIVAAIVLVTVAYVAARLIAAGIRRIARRRGRADLGGIIGSIAFGVIVFVTLLFAAAVVFPSVNPADIIGTLGIGSVAIGFAFRDILQNLFAGVLLLINRPFRRGDQIIVKDYEGTVEHVESRATLIRTYDGRRVIIPNADIYTSPVTVNTAFPVRRSHIDVGIGYGDDPGGSAGLILAAVAKVEGVLQDPAPEVLPWALGDSDVKLRVRWWTDSLRTEVANIQSRVVLAVFEACRDAGIDLPFPTQVVLFHDQTEATDGDRNAQREGWPAGKDPPAPARKPSARKPAARKRASKPG